MDQRANSPRRRAGGDGGGDVSRAIDDSTQDAISRLLQYPHDWQVRRDVAGNSHVTLYDKNGADLHTIVAPTFDEAATMALDLATTPHRSAR